MSSQRKQKHREPLSCESDGRHSSTQCPQQTEAHPLTEKTHESWEVKVPPVTTLSALLAVKLTAPHSAVPLTQEVAELRVQSLQQDAELQELLLHGLLRLLEVLVLLRGTRVTVRGDNKRV